MYMHPPSTYLLSLLIIVLFCPLLLLLLLLLRLVYGLQYSQKLRIPETVAHWQFEEIRHTQCRNCSPIISFLKALRSTLVVYARGHIVITVSYIVFGKYIISERTYFVNKLSDISTELSVFWKSNSSLIGKFVVSLHYWSTEISTSSEFTRTHKQVIDMWIIPDFLV